MFIAEILPNLPDADRLRVSRLALVALALAVAAVALVWRRRTLAVLRDFFTARTAPLNLAIFRVVIFTAIFFDLGNDADPTKITFFSSLPTALQSPPPGWSAILPHMPLDPWWAGLSLTLLAIFSATAALGLFARTSGWLVVLCALYALGIPQYYGKVNHTHHTIWFAAILASSRCADVLSIDALFRRWRAGRRGEVYTPPGPSTLYAMPLRFVWIVLGMIYFFPGFWKVWHSGIDWAWSDNFKYQMYTKWYQVGDGTNPWLPSVRLDHYPLLYKLGALGAIAFELSFLFMIFFRRLRPLAVMMGLGFHIGTRILMKIGFWSLVLGYITFVDWDRLLRRLGVIRSATADPDLDRPTPTSARWGGVAIPRAAVATFAVLFVGNGLAGLAEERDGWPLTCYPPFSGIVGPTQRTIDVVVLDDNNRPIEVNEAALKDRFTKSRYAALMKRLSEDRDPAQLQAFWIVMANQDSRFKKARKVRFYDVTVSTIPEDRGKELAREQVWEAERKDTGEEPPGAVTGA